jgi:zinc D-Ala-D-Ala dipeptidase
MAAVQQAHQQLQQQGYGGLRLFDCYRPQPIQQKMWQIKPDERYVANPATGSDRNRGTAVDLTIVDMNGKPLNIEAHSIAFQVLEPLTSTQSQSQSRSHFLEDDLGMIFDFDFRPNLDNFTIWIDEKSRSNDAHILLAHKFL